MGHAREPEKEASTSDGCGVGEEVDGVRQVANLPHIFGGAMSKQIDQACFTIEFFDILDETFV